MPTITRLKATSTGRKVKVYVDGKFFTKISPDVIYKQGLKKGQDLTGQKLQDLKHKSETEQAVNKALNLLSYRPRSNFEIKIRLQKKYSKPAVENALTQLTEKEYLNDEEFANWFVDQRLKHKPKGPIALKSELYKKGVNRSIIEKVLSEKVSDPDQLKQLARQAAKKKSSYLKLPENEARKKLLSFLNRRGFSYSTSKLVVDELVSKQ